MARVLKIGGSNLHDINSLRSIVKLIRQYKEPVFLVVSAFKGLTDQLYDQIRMNGEVQDTDHFIARLQGKYEHIIVEEFTDWKIREEVLESFSIRINRLENLLKGTGLIGGVPDFVEDEIVSFGERLSSLIISAYLNQNGLISEELLPEHIELLTDGVYHNATLNIDKAGKKLSDKDPSINYVVPGFYGISEERKITVFGRGGSDYSAACLAALLEAKSLDVWKDVDGYLSGDPSLVSQPVQINNLSYREAAELSYFGAKILHPRTVEPLKPRKIPIRIFNFNQAGSELQPYTTIGSARPGSAVIKSVTYNEGIRTLTLRGAAVGITPGILSKVTQQLERNRLNINSVITTQIAISLLLDSSVAEKAGNLISDMNISGVEELDISPELCLIAAVGEGVLSQPGIAGSIFSAVAAKGINIQFISFGASKVAIYFLVDLTDKNDALNAIHKELFNKKQDS